MRVVAFSIAFGILLLSIQGCSSDRSAETQPPPTQPPERATKTTGELDTSLLFRAGSSEWLDGYQHRLDESLSQIPQGTTLDLRLFRLPRPILINSPRSMEVLDFARLRALGEAIARKGYKIRRTQIEGSVELHGQPATDRIEFAAVSPAELAIANPARIDLGGSLFLSGTEHFAPGAKETVEEKAREIPKGTTVDIEVFRQSTGGLKVNRFRHPDEVDRARGQAVRNRLLAIGINARDVIVRGVAEENGRASSRRVELVLAEIERDSAWGRSISMPPERKRIDLGVNLFRSGSEVLSDGAAERIDEMIRSLPRGAVVDIEVFQDSGLWHSRPQTREELSAARGNAIKKHLTAAGFTIREVIVRGPVTYQGRAPSRRVELVVVQ
jgi:outer membrane protein OmpA-like peptidoglycan-associated protein